MLYENYYYPSFNSRITVGFGADFNLIIRDIKNKDEANFFYNQINQYIRIFGKSANFWPSKVTYSFQHFACLGHKQKYILSNLIMQQLIDLMMNLVFNHADGNDQRFVSQTVVLQPVSASAQLGDPVALQCSITSQRTDHSNQCQGEPSVYWFRSGPSHPAAIYMNGNRSGECQDSSGPPSAPQSCVYTLPKNNVDSSDAGTYYCALAACGEVVFGSGTKLDITG